MHLGLSESEFWGLTKDQFGALIEQYHSKVRLDDYRAGILEARIRQVMGGAKNVSAFDSFPHWKKKQEEQERKKGFAGLVNNLQHLEKLGIVRKVKRSNG